MTDRAQLIFEQLVDLADSERASSLQAACADDPQLRGQVEQLLEAHDQAGSFLGDPTIDHAAAYSEPPEQAGTLIGNYKLLEKIGHGGFGDVYMAQQLEPIKRRVALKIIKLGMDTKQVVARFEAERQALALMDHPNIARVLDGGATGSGRPYFVMELVRGDPITDYCDREKLPTRERLRLFQQVCQAIQHAHQKGVIHRDIKPTNVLVTVADGKPLVKVIDFGIAKATNTELTEKTLFTEFRQLIGTPQYMSPEQAERSGVDIDTRSDIYSLGVLLYEILTGRTPVDPSTLKSVAWEELQRRIREEEPLRPSTFVTSQGDLSKNIAKSRGTEPGRLGNLLRGDLDWIVLKALEKDRTRRYGAASELADDVQRHLDDEPVVATPPSAGYRLRKLIRRNKTAIAVAASLAAALLLGLIATTITSVWALSERDHALRAEREARAAEQEASAALELADRQADRARRMAAMVGSPISEAEEAAEMAEAWLADLALFEKSGELSEAEILKQKCQLATWWFQHGGGDEARRLIEQIYDRAKSVLGPNNKNFLALVNMNIVSHLNDYPPHRLADLWVDLMESLRLVKTDEFESLLPQFAAALHKAERDDAATAAVEEYLDMRSGSRPEPSNPAVENFRLQAALGDLTAWGADNSQLYQRLKTMQEELAKQPDAKNPLFARQRPKGRAQVWEGTLDDGESRQQLRFEIAMSDAGEFSGKLIRLDRDSAEATLSRMTADEKLISMRFDSIDATFEATRNSNANEAVGKWTQAGQEWDLTIRRVRSLER